MDVKDSLVDLNSLLFEEMERLSNPDIEEDDLRLEMQRASAMSQVAKNIINNADLVLRAAKFKDEQMNADYALPKMLGGKDG